MALAITRGIAPKRIGTPSGGSGPARFTGGVSRCSLRPGFGASRYNPRPFARTGVPATRFHLKIHEYQAKALLKSFGVPVPSGEVATTADEAQAIAARLGTAKVVVKAQNHSAGRGK